MTILKNEAIFTPGPKDYSKPRHIIVEGSNEEIGYDLAKLAQTFYGLASLPKFENSVYGEARHEYLLRNWPSLLSMSKGVLRAYGLPDDDKEHDATQLPYDFYYNYSVDDIVDAGIELTTCSAVVLPKEKSLNGGVFVSRNFDLWNSVIWTGVLTDEPQGADKYRSWERGIVMEKRAVEGGYKSITIGGHDALLPYTDGINEKGLYYTLLHDPAGVGVETGPPSGGCTNGLSLLQIGTLILEKCATVKEAKIEILKNRIMQTMMCGHMFMVDAVGDAAIFEIDKKSQAYVFVDRQIHEPLFVTNRPVSTYKDSSTFPKYDKDAEHNTFWRMDKLSETYAGLKAPFSKDDATSLTDIVHCAFIDDKKAQAGKGERTLYNITADLTIPEISVRYYLGDVGPIDGTNHMKDRMTKYYTFGFDK